LEFAVVGLTKMRLLRPGLAGETSDVSTRLAAHMADLTARLVEKSLLLKSANSGG
jgi:hypothetical protein